VENVLDLLGLVGLLGAHRFVDLLECLRERVDAEIVGQVDAQRELGGGIAAADCSPQVTV
jgi:hypothetical protein